MEIDLLKTGLAYVTLTCKTSNGQKLKGVHISGFCDLDKNSVTLISDGMGIVSGYVIPATNTSFSMVSMLDLNPASVSLSNVVAGNKYMGEIVLSGVEKNR